MRHHICLHNLWQLWCCLYQYRQLRAHQGAPVRGVQRKEVGSASLYRGEATRVPLSQVWGKKSFLRSGRRTVSQSTTENKFLLTLRCSFLYLLRKTAKFSRFWEMNQKLMMLAFRTALIYSIGATKVVKSSLVRRLPF